MVITRTHTVIPNLGPVGVGLEVSGAYLEEAAELEQLGFTSLWLPGSQITELDRLADLVHATTAVPVGSAVVSVDVYQPPQVARFHARLQPSPGRCCVTIAGA